MPFLWKKAKRSRISQLVADRFNSSKHGGSLVVQTGFPTSLIDLFHKNRDRLKKSTKKKRSTADDLPPEAASGPFNTSDSLSYWDSELENSQECSTKMELLTPETELLTPRCSTNELPILECSLRNQIKDDLVSVKCDKVGDDRQKIFVVFLKVLFVVVLALVTKRLVVGISLCTFTLILLDYVGNCISRLSKSHWDYRKWLRVMVARFLCFVRIKGKRCTDLDYWDSVKGLDLNVQSLKLAPVLEYQIESMTSVDFEKALDFGKIDMENVDLGKEDECRSVNNREGNGRARIKSKMKKLVEKKLCKPKRKAPGLEGGVLISIKRNEDTEKDHSKNTKQIERNEEKFDYKVDKVSEVTSDSCELKQSDSKANAVVVETGRETAWTSKYWMICLIVLSGLVGGRIFAIAFTLCSFLILKPLETKETGSSSLRSSAKVTG